MQVRTWKGMVSTLADLADEGEVGDEVFVDELVQNCICFPCCGRINCMSVAEDFCMIAF